MSYKIEELYAYVIKQDNGDDGIVACRNDKGEWLPLVGSKRELMTQYAPIVEGIAAQHKRPIRFMRFTFAEQLDEIRPEPEGGREQWPS